MNIKLLIFLSLLIACQSESKRFRRETSGIKSMIAVPQGSFRRGDQREGLPTEKPIRMVKINAFYIDETPVTYLDFEKYVADGGEKSAYWDDKNYHQNDIPVTGVSWHSAVDFCNWRSKKEGISPAYWFANRYDAYGYPIFELDTTADGYRLPTEAEFEYAARGGLRLKKYAYGDVLNEKKVNFDKGNIEINDDGTWSRIENASKQQRNGFGLRGMAGNVWHWCHDWFDATYYEQKNSVFNPLGAESGIKKSLRGGSWGSSLPSDLSVFRRNGMAAGNYRFDVGFRCVRPRKPKTKQAAGDEMASHRFYSPKWQKKTKEFDGNWYGEEMKTLISKFIGDNYPNSIYFQRQIDEQAVLNPTQMAALIVLVCEKHQIHPLFLLGVMAAESNLGSCSLPRWFNNPMAYHWQNRLMANGDPLYDAPNGIRNQKYKNLEDAFAAFCVGIRKSFYLARAHNDLNDFHLLYVGYDAPEWIITLTRTYRDAAGIDLSPHEPEKNIGAFIYADWNKIAL